MNFNIIGEGGEIDMAVATHLMECLLSFLKGAHCPRSTLESITETTSCNLDTIPPSDSNSMLAHPIELANRLASLIADALHIPDNCDADLLACTAFGTLLKVSLIADDIWAHFKNNVMSSELLQRLLLDEHNVHKRSQVALWIKKVYEASAT